MTKNYPDSTVVSNQSASNTASAVLPGLFSDLDLVHHGYIFALHGYCESCHQMLEIWQRPAGLSMQLLICSRYLSTEHPGVLERHRCQNATISK